MATYRALYDNKKLVSVNPAKDETSGGDTFLEETTGETIWATLEAGSDEEVQEKAERLETELQTGQTKETIMQKENSQ